MSLMVPRKAYKIVVLLLVCLAVGAAFACQIHPASSGHEHAMPDMHHTSSASHPGFDSSCVIAVLPVMMVFLAWFFFAFYAAPRMSKYTVPVFPPFIPPRFSAL